MARKPDFLVIGASKAGTSSFCEMLEQHPQVTFTRPSEPNFFSVHYDKGWGWYEARFPEHEEGGILGDKSPTYSHVQAYPDVPGRIYRDLPSAKLVYVVRHPLDRIESRWMQDRASGRRQNDDDFNGAVRRNLYGIIDTTRYLQQVDAYRRHFSDDQLHVVFFEEVIERPKEVMAKSFAFLGINADFSPMEVPHTNPSLGKKEDGRLLTHLRRYLPEDTRRLPVPTKVRSLARAVLKQPVHRRPSWNESTLAWVRQELGEETRTFLRRYGPYEDYWRL